MYDERNDLHLAVTIETDNTDVCVRVLSLACSDLLKYLAWVSAAEHRKLPHSPVATIVVARRSVVLTVYVTVLKEKTKRKEVRQVLLVVTCNGGQDLGRVPRQDQT